MAKIIELFPYDYLVLTLSSANGDRRTIEDLAEAVKKISPSFPFSIGDEQLRAFRLLQEIMSSSLSSTPTENPTIIPSTDPSTIPRVPVAMSPRNQPGTPTTSPRTLKPHLISTYD